MIMIPIDAVRIGAARRKTEKAKVAALAESIALLGLRTPITVLPADADGRHGLVTGRNRLEASRLLGHTEIAAVVEGDKLAAQLWEIAENFHRSDLTAIQRSALVGRWLKLAARMRKGGPGAPLGGMQPHDRGAHGVSRALGIPRTSARRAIKVSEHLSPAAKREAERLGLAKNMRALSSAAGCSGDAAQVADLQRTAAKIAKRKAERSQVKAVLAGTDKPRSPQEAFDRWFNSFDIVMKVQIRIWLLSKDAEVYFDKQEQIEQQRKALH